MCSSEANKLAKNLFSSYIVPPPVKVLHILLLHLGTETVLIPQIMEMVPILSFQIILLIFFKGGPLLPELTNCFGIRIHDVDWKATVPSLGSFHLGRGQARNKTTTTLRKMFWLRRGIYPKLTRSERTSWRNLNLVVNYDG